jgi:hypothetical protein
LLSTVEAASNIARKGAPPMVTAVVSDVAIADACHAALLDFRAPGGNFPRNLTLSIRA